MRDLRHVIVFEKRKETQDQITGAIKTDWSEVASVRAKVTPLSGKDFIAAHEKQVRIDARIKIRYNRSIDDTMRIKFRGDVYAITAILCDNDSGLEWMTLHVHKGVERNA